MPEDRPFTEKSNAIVSRIKDVLLNTFSAGDTLLEIGCGNGRVSFALEKLGYRPVGIDIAEAPIAFAKDYAIKNGFGAEFFLADGESFSLPYLFDGVLLLQNNVVEYSPQGLNNLIERSKAHLKQNGVLVLEMNCFDGEPDANEDEIKIPNKGVFYYKTFSHPASFVYDALCSAFGCVDKTTIGKRVVFCCRK